ncbi:MAG: lysophospholipase, partial [Desulfobacterales bacterium]|nr:lysophospholipase [Desulfobacterales bacterium]
MMKRIVCLGDSLTEGADLEKSSGWTALVENALGVEVVNRGMGGDVTGGMLSRFYPDVVTLKPDIV